MAGIAFDAKGDLYAVVPTSSFEGLYANFIAEFSPSGSYIGVVNYLTLEDPTGLAIGPDGNLYITDYQGNQVAEYSPSGAFLDISPRQTSTGPTGSPSVPLRSPAVLGGPTRHRRSGRSSIRRASRRLRRERVVSRSAFFRTDAKARVAAIPSTAADRSIELKGADFSCIREFI